MKKLILTVAALIVAVGAQAQGYFEFNTRNTTIGEVVTFLDAGGAKLSGADYWVQVFAGPANGGVAGLVALDGPLALNRTGSGAGLANPFSKSYTTALPAGPALIGYQSYQGSSFATATAKSDLITTKLGSTTPLTVTLVEAPNLPNSLTLGTGNVSLVPEPATLALGLIGLGTLLAFRRRQ